jgi:hypothetical protein
MDAAAGLGSNGSMGGVGTILRMGASAAAGMGFAEMVREPRSDPPQGGAAVPKPLPGALGGALGCWLPGMRGHCMVRAAAWLSTRALGCQVSAGCSRLAARLAQQSGMEGG